MDIKVDLSVVEHLYKVIMQKSFEQKVPFTPQKKPFEKAVIKQKLKRAKPQEVGVDPRLTAEFLNEVQNEKGINVHQMMVVKDDAVILEGAFLPYKMDIWHVSHSLCKTVTSMAIGILIGDGKLSTEDKLVKVLDSKIPALSKFKLGKITVKHLLTMSTGAGVNESLLCAESDWLKAFAETSLHFEPGSKFHYNSINSYVLSCIVQEITGVTMFEFLKERLFEPLGITTIWWESCPMGRTKGGWGMYILPEDMAKLGLLLLQKGEWKGKQIISPQYVADMSKKQMDFPDQGTINGYGYQTWMGKEEGAFMFNGMLGQNIHVIPSKNMVVVVTGGNENLFADCKINEIIFKYFQSGELSFKPSLIPPRKGRLKNDLAWWQNTGRAKLHKNGLPLAAMDLNGKTCKIEKCNVRLQPLFAQFINNSYSKGVDSLSFSVEGDKFILSISEGELTNKLAVGFKAPVYSVISVNGELYNVAAHGAFAKDEDGVAVLKITIPFIEHSNGRIIKIFFLRENKLRIEWYEFPGRAVINGGAKNFMSALNPVVANQVKSYFDIDMVLPLVDRLMEPVVYGELV